MKNEGFSTRISYPLLLAIFALLLYFPGLGSRDLWAPVEPRYAEIARVMLARGEWVIPTVNGDLYTDKPILYFWLVLASAKALGGVNEWSVRLPSAISAIGLVLVTYALGRDLLGARAGFFGAIVLATTVRVLWEGRWAHTDTLFTFFFTISLYFWARAHFGRGDPREFLLAYGLMGLATLTKGLIGIALPGLILVCHVAARRDWRSMLDWRLPSGALVFLLAAFPWFAQVTLVTDGRWLEDFIFVHHFRRYMGWLGHEKPFYYYLQNFPADFLPWTLFLIPALTTRVPARASLKKPIPLFFLVWFVAVFIFFSLSISKRALYLLPLFPPVALFVGHYFDGLLRGEHAQGAIYRWLSYLLFGLFCGTGLALPVVTSKIQPDVLRVSFLMAALLVCGGSVGIVGVLRRRPALVFEATAATALLTMLCTALWILPHVDQYKSPKGFALEVKRLVPQDETLYVYADSMNDFNFYTEREVMPVISSRDELWKLFGRSASAYLLIRERDLSGVSMSDNIVLLAEGQIGGKKWSLARIRPAGPVNKVGDQHKRMK